MFGIGMPEMLLILAIALIVIGPKKLPDLAKYLGRAIGEFKNAASDLKESIDINSDIKDVKSQFGNISDNIQGTVDVEPDLEQDKQSELSDSNNGDSNPNDSNSGDSNSGDSNSGDSNSGDSNSNDEPKEDKKT